MGSTAVEKTEEELRQETNELLPQQRQISERLRSPPGFERGGLSDAGPRNFAANVARQTALVRPITEHLRSPPGFERGGLSAAGPCNFAANVARQGDLVRPFEADGNEAEDHPPAKRRLLSGVVKVEDGATIENDADKEQLAEEGNIKVGNVSDKRPSNIQQSGWSRRDGTQRELKKDNEALLTEHIPGVFPKNEGPSLVSTNKRMRQQLLGTSEISERLHSPPGFERGGLSAVSPCNFAANVARQGDLIRPVIVVVFFLFFYGYTQGCN
ncbi:hypothetical protein K2173_020824 [Erythroxylum novogranatense]|uniref:Uncharacterized protein n=1 Tax=Erythroxylum novogranatense TaxID=1862640 RepID=A0AAV8TP81_9ROSI|nr:hypothetical protein K2173_020824 [Erythroxylum novogranatense]